MRKYGGSEVADAKRLKALEAENAKLKKTLAEQMMDVATLKETLGKNFSSPVRGGRPWTGPWKPKATISGEPVRWPGSIRASIGAGRTAFTLTYCRRFPSLRRQGRG